MFFYKLLNLLINIFNIKELISKKKYIIKSYGNG